MPCGVARIVEANGLRLQCYAWGEPARPPALLLHSLAAHSHWWDWAAPLLAERRHVIALDFRGHGGSQWAEPPAYRYDDYVVDVRAALDALRLAAPLVIGHSLGGYVGALFAARHAARVGALVIVDMLTGWSETQERWARAQAERSAPEFGSAAEGGARFRLVPPETRAPAEWLLHLGETGLVERAPGAWRFAFDRRVFLHPAPDPWPFLAEVACPTLVLRGESSTIMDGAAAKRVAAAVREGRAAEVPDTFHHLVLDDPANFVARVSAWLDDREPKGGRT